MSAAIAPLAIRRFATVPKPRILKGAIIAALLAILYARTGQNLVRDWLNDPGASHGILIPFVAAGAAWLDRERILATPARNTGAGLVVVAFACVLLLAASVAAETFLANISIVCMAAGLIWTFWGRARVRAVLFPLILLLTMVPLPAIVYTPLAVPLQLFTCRAAAAMLQFFGMIVSLDGNIVYLPNMALGVAEACSGLRALPSFVVMALLFAFLQCRKWQTRSVLIAVSVPVAMATNVGRVVGTAILANMDERYALGFYHSFSGWLMLVAGLLAFWAVAKLFRSVIEPEQVRL